MQSLNPSLSQEGSRSCSHPRSCRGRNGSPLAGRSSRRRRPICATADALAAERRALPWVKVEKAYVFDTTSGPEDPGRAVRRPQPAHRAPPDVRPGMERRLPGLLLPGRAHRRTGARTSSGTTCGSSPCPARRWTSFWPTRRAWGGASSGCPPQGDDFNRDFRVTLHRRRGRERPHRLQLRYDRDRPPLPRAGNCPASASSSRTRPARCSTLIRPTRAALTCCSAPSLPRHHPRRPQRWRPSELAPPPRRIRLGRLVAWLSASPCALGRRWGRRRTPSRRRAREAICFFFHPR